MGCQIVPRRLWVKIVCVCYSTLRDKAVNWSNNMFVDFAYPFVNVEKTFHLLLITQQFSFEFCDIF